MVECFFIAVSLAMDAFAVAVSSGIAVPGFGWRQAVKLGVWFGGFQFIMPLIGWLMGGRISGYVGTFSHLAAFGVLAAIGGRMVWEALHQGPGRLEEPEICLTAGRLSLMALATSIDAMAVGLSMAFLRVDIWIAAWVIGGVAFFLSVAGGLLGRRLGHLFRRRAKLAGGLLLLGIGVKLLLVD